MRRGTLCAIIAASLLVFGAAGISARSQATGRSSANPVDASGPSDLASARLRQRAVRLELSANTRGPWALGDLTRFPNGGEVAQPFLCLQLRQRAAPRSCVSGRAPANRNVLALSRPIAGGPPRSRSLIGPASVTEHQLGPGQLLVASRRPPRPPRVGAGLPLGWTLVRGRRGPPCGDRVPDGDELIELGVEEIRPTGCTRRGARFHTHGPRGRKRIAIGFDDGPSSLTPGVLRILRRFDPTRPSSRSARRRRGGERSCDASSTRATRSPTTRCTMRASVGGLVGPDQSADPARYRLPPLPVPAARRRGRRRSARPGRRATPQHRHLGRRPRDWSPPMRGQSRGT